MRNYKVYIAPETKEPEALKWCWETFARFAQIEYTFTDENQSEFSIGNEVNNTVRYNPKFWKKIDQNIYSGKEHLNKKGLVEFENGETDYFTTAFYFINCIWEYDTYRRDNLGRSDYSQSVWKELDLDCTENKIANLFCELCVKLTIPVPDSSSQIFLSHDIDSLYGAWKEDGKSALKQGKIVDFIAIQIQHFFKKPQWFNIEEIMKIENNENAFSTFFWLTEKGRINKRKTNADYSLSEKRVKEAVLKCKEIGLHKSLSDTDLRTEFGKLNPPERINRYHYLHYSIPDCYTEWEKAELKADCSLGFAETIGFRNGYGSPFFPFNILKRETLPVLEIPLHIMDGTFSKYKQLSDKDAESLIKEFITKNRKHAVISILWHNSHFTNYKYKGYGEVYKNTLRLCNDLGLRYTSVKKLLVQFNKTVK